MSDNVQLQHDDVVDFKKVAHAEGMEDGLDWIARFDDRSYGFKTVERGHIMVVSMSVDTSSLDDEYVVDYVPRNGEFKSLPLEVEKHIRSYFRQKHDEDITITSDI